jgi:hypothetical protein
LEVARGAGCAAAFCRWVGALVPEVRALQHRVWGKKMKVTSAARQSVCRCMRYAGVRPLFEGGCGHLAQK